MTNKIRFGIIGTNIITEKFIKSAQLCEEFELTAIYSRTEKRGREFAEKYGVKDVFIDLEDLLKSDLIDAMYIASPNAFHAKQAIMCLNHQKHVLCEKPLASNLREVKEMIEAAEANGVLLMEAMKTTYYPNLHLIKENLHKIGSVRRYFAQFCRASSTYDDYLKGSVPNVFNPNLSTGALVDVGIYTIAPMVYLFGKPKQVQANAYLLESGADGQGTVSFQYEGMEANIIYSKISDSFLPTEIQGEDGSIVIDSIQKFSSVKIHYRNGEVEELATPQQEQRMYYEVRAFLDTILANHTEAEINSYQFSKDMMQLLDEARRQIGLVYPADQENNDI